jgi:hypothetical protein
MENTKIRLFEDEPHSGKERATFKMKPEHKISLVGVTPPVNDPTCSALPKCSIAVPSQLSRVKCGIYEPPTQFPTFSEFDLALLKLVMYIFRFVLSNCLGSC